MSELLDPELQASARRLVGMDAKRTRLAKLLRYDIDADVFNRANSQQIGEGTVPILDFVRAIPSSFASMLVDFASNDFCEAAEKVLGVKTLPATTAPAGHKLSGNPYDRVVEFPGGLILRSVAAAHHVIYMSELDAAGQQDTLQTS